MSGEYFVTYALLLDG